MNNYSVLNAITGSFFAAYLEGINPAINVKNILITTNIIPPANGNLAILPIPANPSIIKLIGIHNTTVTPTPSKPDAKPIINVSALKILEISF